MAVTELEPDWKFACLTALQQLHEALDVIEAMIKAGDGLSFMAQTSGGAAGHDADLVAAIKGWQEVKDKCVAFRRFA